MKSKRNRVDVVCGAVVLVAVAAWQGWTHGTFIHASGSGKGVAPALEAPELTYPAQEIEGQTPRAEDLATAERQLREARKVVEAKLLPLLKRSAEERKHLDELTKTNERLLQQLTLK